MQQDPLVLFIDLQAEAESFRSTLTSQGFKVASISLEEATTGIAQGQPRAVLAPQERAAAVVTLIAAVGVVLEIPFFTLSKSGPSSQMPPLRGVTAVLPHDIDPGVLCLRLATVLSQPQSRRVSQATLVGVGIDSLPPPLPFASRPPLSSPAPSSPASSSSDSSVTTSARGYTGTAVQSVPTSKTRSMIPSASSPSASSPSASSPSASSPSVSSPSVSPPAAAAPEGESTVKALSPSGITPPVVEASEQEAPAPSPSPSPSRSERPVTLSSPLPPGVDADVAAMLQGQAAQKGRRAKIAALLGALVVVGGGAAFAMSSTASKPSETVAAEIDKSAIEVAKPADAGQKLPEPEAAKQVPEKVDAPVDEKESLDAEVALFQIKAEKEMESCEKVLGNPQTHYEKMAPWKSANAWKLARRALMKGDSEQGQKHMCEAAFIDPKGAATLGLARYYLSVRALDQAEKWARLGIEVSPKAKRTAKELLGDVLCQRGKMKEAREVWLESFDLSSDQTSRLAAVTRRFVTAAGKAERGGDAAAAERHLRRAAAFDLENANVASDLASILVKTGEPDLARAWAEKALALDGSSKVAKGVLSELK